MRVIFGCFVWIIFQFPLCLEAQRYVKGDFHQHTTYTDGSYSIGHMMSKNNAFGLDWWANSEHGGPSLRNGRISGSETGNTVSSYWDEYHADLIRGIVETDNNHRVMWRWQVLLDSSFTEVLKARTQYPSKLILQSYEMNIPGHEHGSIGIIDDQFTAHPDCKPLAEFEYKFDERDRDTLGDAAMGWTKSKLTGHAKALEALGWLKHRYPTSSYWVIAHPERYTPATRGYSIATLRDFNDAAPDICFGFEGIPGHHKESERGLIHATSVGGCTYGGTGIYAARIGGMWDALLSEGRRFWLFSNSDSHSEKGDFYPGEYQKNYTNVAGSTAQDLVNGLRSGNNWVVTGDLIDSLRFEVQEKGQPNQKAGMGSKLMVTPGTTVRIRIEVRDPQGTNFNHYSAYTQPQLDHVDLIQGQVGEKVSPQRPEYRKDSVTSTKLLARFDGRGGVVSADGLCSRKWKKNKQGLLEMEFVIKHVTGPMYFRLRGTNHGLNAPNETDGNGNPLPDSLLAPNDATKAFADLWFYSNPLFVYPRR